MRLLSQPEVDRLLLNDAALRGRLVQHQNIVASSGWDQTTANKVEGLPVPVRGYRTRDIWLGDVIIFPDADGDLWFVYPEGIAQWQSLVNEIDRAIYYSPDEGLLALVNDILNRAGATLKTGASLTAVGVGIGLVALLALNAGMLGVKRNGG